MNIRFEAVGFLDNSNEYDFDNARYLCTVEHADYTEYIKLLYLMQQNDKSEYGNITLRYDNENGVKVEEYYSIVDITLVVPKDKVYTESIVVYVIGG